MSDEEKKLREVFAEGKDAAGALLYWMRQEISFEASGPEFRKAFSDFEAWLYRAKGLANGHPADWRPELEGLCREKFDGKSGVEVLTTDKDGKWVPFLRIVRLE